MHPILIFLGFYLLWVFHKEIYKDIKRLILGACRRAWCCCYCLARWRWRRGGAGQRQQQRLPPVPLDHPVPNTLVHEYREL